MLQISNLGDQEALFLFMDGLKPWAKQELQRRGVQTVNQAMTVAESLVEFKRPDKGDSSKNKGKGKVGGDKEKPNKSGGSGKPPFYKGKSSKEGDKKEEKKPLACF